MQKLLIFFQQKISVYLPYFKIQYRNFNVMLAETLFSFEQLGPDCLFLDTFVIIVTVHTVRLLLKEKVLCH